ncbi:MULTISPECIES: methanogen output domain 1-containing protein [Methanobacterium]|jgi:CheY-like chemotaxis protein|uniref:Methanogen output domain 1-containing protein n=1 Tax=Methanobacterium subterraneum TaxID=59277 RepID=A0A7K4DPK0_9EURY|nr:MULTISPECIES: methanogen output domain 1-containing protein [Methanobacterium]MBW4257283.1 methanogen output domain 1-containing protein [Methanobacterium sp. YSL]MCC7558982.1 methanogen output domain 1-containing protein [Methanobacterium sp.]NMO10269.1 methanogen output domain 1-containing protein [Methanobacterium subterraneum]PKL73781.1 MAG: response regulator [Methanobacteriales archaeon HGW-Methanobacteriales-2]
MTESRILVVEDEAIVAMGIKQKLEDLGHQVVDVVFTGENAVETALKMEPDLILMDIVLKGNMDGIEAAAKIRNQLDIPVIYLTAYSDEEVLERARMTEPYGYIIKPFKKSELNANIEMALYKHAEDQKKSENVKKQILADFYDFILNSMPTTADQSDEEIKNTLLKIFASRLEEEMRPRFERELGDTVEEQNLNDLESIYNAYLDWVAHLFADFGVQTKIEPKGHLHLFKFLNCPWIDDAKKKPIFCLNCQAIMQQTYDWTGMEGKVEKKATIADGSDMCVFKFNVPFMKKN